MCGTVIKYSRKVDYVLIDTFSTLNFYFAFVVSQLSRILGLKYIPILHGGNLPTRLKNNPGLCRRIFKNSYKNVAPSMYLKSHFEKNNYSTEYIPNIIEVRNYPYKARTVLLPKLLWVRAFDKIYNPQMAIEVLLHLKRKFPKAQLCMVGPAKDETFKQCQELVAKYELKRSVTFTGLLKKEAWHDMAKDYDIFINTTNVDNTPVSVMEAMALGLPVVSTNVGGIPFLLENEVDGILVEKQGVEMMANAISKLIGQENTILSRNARKKVEGFSWNEVKQKWFSILE